MILIWGGSRVFRGFDTAFLAIYETDSQKSLKQKIKTGLVVMVTVVMTVVLIAVSVLFLRNHLIVTDPLRVVALTFILLPLYYIYPESEVRIKDILPGAVFASISIMVLQPLFQIYVRNTSGASGLMGAVLVLVLWFYVASTAILTGGVVNATLEKRRETKTG